jgi:hypothetical protein
LVRASACHAEGRGFEPRRSRHDFASEFRFAREGMTLLLMTLSVGLCSVGTSASESASAILHIPFSRTEQVILLARQYLAQDAHQRTTERDFLRAGRALVEGTNPRAAMRMIFRVGILVATAFSTGMHPLTFTIIDRRAYRTLNVDFHDPIPIDEYLHYREFCRDQATRLAVSLREYDHALWQAAPGTRISCCRPLWPCDRADEPHLRDVPTPR